MDFTIDAFIWLIVLGTTIGIVLGTTTSFIRFGFKLWKYIALIGIIIWIVKSWV